MLERTFDDGVIGNWEACKNGEITIQAERNTKKIYIHSKFNPKQEAQKEIEKFNRDDHSLIVVFGLGMGYFVEEILSTMSKSNHLLILEPSPTIFTIASSQKDFSSLLADQRVHFSYYENRESITAFLNQHMNDYNSNNVRVFITPSYFTLFHEKATDLVAFMNEIRQKKITGVNTIKRLAPYWQKNILENTKYIYNSFFVDEFFNQFQNIPAIIVSAGPSLDKNIALLKEAKNKALLLSTDTALSPLLKHHIRPDFVFSVDAYYYVYRKLQGIAYDDIPLVFIPASYEEIVREHHGKKILSSTTEPYIHDLLKKIGKNSAGLHSHGGSVACDAFDFAVKAACNPIIFVGQDLAYNDMGNTRAKNTMYDKEAMGAHYTVLKSGYENRSYVIKDVYGNDTYTDVTFNTYRLWFEERIAQHQNFLFIDSTEGGAFIHGTEVMPLAETLEKYCQKSVDFKAQIERIFQNSTLLSAKELSFIGEAYKETEKVLTGLFNQVTEAKKMAEQLVSEYKKDFQNEKLVLEINNKLLEINEIIEASEKHFAIASYLFEPNIIAINKKTLEDDLIEDPKQKAIAFSETRVLYYECLASAIGYALPLLEKAVHQLKETF